ncbi:meiosis initiator protein isoform X2 [Hyaena hyaena]|uniref:meiosis initiator protein isoform X2 n=1 Tax=Hyaena hyaena TaxID=95912 RepID=UPI001924ABD0|nr:meiosis initiator protein isoform X2 [Hyaena hyaena]
MWRSSRHLSSPEWPRTSPLGPSERRQRKNHTSKLQELALLLPVALKTGTKKLTKKEILLHVLHYIQYLQKNIDVAKALLTFHTVNGEGGLGGLVRNQAKGLARLRHFTPSRSPHWKKSRLQGACRKPRKKKLTGSSERQTRAQKPRRCLALDKPKKWVTPSPDEQGGNVGRTSAPSRCTTFCSHPKVASAPPPDDRKGGRSRLTLLDMAESSVRCDISSCWCRVSAQGNGPYLDFRAQQGAEGIHFLNRTRLCPRQKTVFYDSSEEVDKESPDADPWLPAWTPEGSPHGCSLALGPPQSNKLAVTGHPSEILGLSPSLFNSPGNMLPEQILEDGTGTEYLTQALFEEALLDPESSPPDGMLEVPQNEETPPGAPEGPPDPHPLCPSSISLDHCYLSLSEASKAPSSSSSEDTDEESVWRQPEDTEADPEGLQSSSDEDGDYTWTPTRRASTLPPAGRKARKGQAGKSQAKPKENMRAPCPAQMKKKCVNGFIMFCRMNRKQYIRACPGTASTAATKELAQLWRVMTQQERRPYCVKARRFSLQHNRIVKRDSSSSEDEDWGPPKPFYQLMAEKAGSSPDLASLLPPLRD